jgi:hypothetical protein
MSYVVKSSYWVCCGCRLKRVEGPNIGCTERIIGNRFASADESRARSTARLALATRVGNNVFLARIPFIRVEVRVQEVSAIEVGTVKCE